MSFPLNQTQPIEASDVIVIGDDEQDLLVDALERATKSQGIKLSRITANAYLEANTCIVSPKRHSVYLDKPILLRHLKYSHNAAGTESAFLDLERHAALKSFLALNKKPVINRPQTFDCTTWLTPAPFLSRSHAANWSIREEIFSSERPAGGNAEMQEFENYSTAYSHDDLLSEGPWRSRQGAPSDRLYVCVAIGNHVLPTHPRCPLPLCEATLEVSQQLNLTCCAVTWNESLDKRKVPRLARIDAVPFDWQIAGVKDDAARLLLVELGLSA